MTSNTWPNRTLWYAALTAMAVFSILPAFRLQLFAESYNPYYSIRAALFALLIAAFATLSRTFDRNLSVGNAKPARTGYGDPLLTLRALACSIVVIGHGASINFAPSDLIHQAAQSRGFWLLLPLPMAGVFIFFTLSGYLMGKSFFTGRYSFSRDGICRFYRNRYLRIAPLAYFAIAIVILFQRPDALSIPNIKYLVALLLFDYDGTSPMSLIGLLASICTEMQFYLIAPFMALGIHTMQKRFGAIKVFSTLLCAGLVYRLSMMHFADDRWVTSVYVPMIGNLDLFGIGMATSYFVQAQPLKSAKLWYAIILLATVWVACALLWSKWIVAQATVRLFLYYLSPSLFCIVTALIIIIMENASRFDTTPARWSSLYVKHTQRFGNLTYALYIWHAPIFATYALTVPKPTTSNDTIVALGTATVLALAFSQICHIIIERPIDRIKSAGHYVNNSDDSILQPTPQR